MTKRSPSKVEPHEKACTTDNSKSDLRRELHPTSVLTLSSNNERFGISAWFSVNSARVVKIRIKLSATCHTTVISSLPPRRKIVLISNLSLPQFVEADRENDDGADDCLLQVWTDPKQVAAIR